MTLNRGDLLLLAHGTPDTPESVPEFLRNVTGGRPLPEAVVKEIQHRYSLIGQSPLTCWTFDQAEKISAELGMPAYVGMRNWKPYISDTVKKMAEDGVTVISATHDHKMLAVSDRVVYLTDGRVVYGVSVSRAGLTQLWWTPASAAAWQKQ